MTRPRRHHCNNAERQAIERLESEGWTVYRKGWPDFLCVRDQELRLIEVKAGVAQVSKAQANVFDVFKVFFGLEVEVYRSAESGVTPRPSYRPALPSPQPPKPILLPTSIQIEVRVGGPVYVRNAPYNEQFRAQAALLRGRYYPPTGTWTFSHAVADAARQLVIQIYGAEKVQEVV